RRRRDRADRHGAAPARLPRGAAGPGSEQGADPDPRVGLHGLRPEPGGGARLGAAPQAGRAAAGAHRAGPRVRAAYRPCRRRGWSPAGGAHVRGTPPTGSRLRTVSLRRRVTALSMLVLAAVLVVVTVLTDVVFAAQTRAGLRDELAVRAALAGQLVAQGVS